MVHNGIIENYAALKRELMGHGHVFKSDTDTEVIAHLLEEAYHGDILSAMRLILPRLEGSYALLVLAEGDPRMIAARQYSPLVLGIGDRATFAASDMTPILAHTRRMIVLEDGDVACLVPDAIEIFNGETAVMREEEIVQTSVEAVKKGGFAHFMIKEIFEQPDVFSSAIRTLRRNLFLWTS